jgi:hypothetical protein
MGNETRAKAKCGAKRGDKDIEEFRTKGRTGDARRVRVIDETEAHESIRYMRVKSTRDELKEVRRQKGTSER